MLPFNKYNILSNQNIQNDFISEENIEQIVNCSLEPNSSIQSKKDLKDDFSFPLNNNYLLSPLINNINYIKEKENQTKISTDDKKGINEKSNNKFIIKKNYIETNNCTEKTLDSKEYNEKKRRLGRKRKNDDSPGLHNKYSSDNLIRKCKHIILSKVMDFINQKIKDIYNGKIGDSIFKKELLTLNKTQIYNTNVNFNKNFLSKTLGEIFSDDISTKFTCYRPDHNKLLIISLKNEEDQNKKNYFTKLFNITYLQCIYHIIGYQKIDELSGLICISQLKEEMSEEKEYIQCIEYFLNNYEKITKNKRSRQRKKNRTKDICI